MIALFIAGSLASFRGEPVAAMPVLERSLQLGRTWDLHLHVGHVSYRLGRALLVGGRIGDGRRALEQAREHQEQRGNHLHQAITLAWLARAYDLEGRTEEGLDLARRAVQMASEQHQRGDHAYCLLLLADIQARPDLQPALRTFQQALSLAEELGMRPLQAHCHLGLGKLLRRIGHTDEARTELATAVEMLREMGMTFWLPEAERELAATTAGSAEPTG